MNCKLKFFILALLLLSSFPAFCQNEKTILDTGKINYRFLLKNYNPPHYTAEEYAAMHSDIDILKQRDDERRFWSISLVVGSDLTDVLSQVGLEFGSYGEQSRHSFMLTASSDFIRDVQLVKYERSEKINPATSGFSSFRFGVRYGFRAFSVNNIEVNGIVHAWRIPWLYLNGLEYGIRVVSKKRDYKYRIGGEVSYDPHGKRWGVKFVCTPKFPFI